MPNFFQSILHFLTVSVTVITTAITAPFHSFKPVAPSVSQQVVVVTSTPTRTPPAFEYEGYDKVFGTSGPKAIFFTDLFFQGNLEAPIRKESFLQK